MAFLGTSSTANFLKADAVPMVATQDFTIMCWVFYETTSEIGRLYMIGRDGTNGYGAGIGTNNDSSAGNEVLHVYDGVAWIDVNVGAGTGWHHIALVDDATSQTIYLDGVNIGTAIPNAVAATQNTTVGVAFDVAAGQALSGENRVSCIKIWTSKLTQAQIQIEMQSQFPVFNFSTLAMFWPLEKSGGALSASNGIDFTQKFTTIGAATGAPGWADNPPIARC